MNSSLQKQLEKLGRTLAAKSNQPTELFEFPKLDARMGLRVSLRDAKAANPFCVEETALQPLQETLASFSARQVARVAAYLNPLAR